MAKEIEVPEIVTNDHLKYLDHLRGTGVTNMFGAGPFLSRRFGVDETDASTILGYWMESFSERHPE